MKLMLYGFTFYIRNLDFYILYYSHLLSLALKLRSLDMVICVQKKSIFKYTFTDNLKKKSILQINVLVKRKRK